MEIDKIKNFFMLFFEKNSNVDNSNDDFAIIGLEQMADENGTYRVIAVPNATEISTYICGGGAKQISFAFQYKQTVSGVKQGGNMEVLKAYDFYDELDKWLYDIYHTTTYSDYYNNNKTKNVMDGLDYSNWISLKLTGQPNIVDFSADYDTAVFTCMCQLDYEY